MAMQNIRQKDKLIAVYDILKYFSPGSNTDRVKKRMEKAVAENSAVYDDIKPLIHNITGFGRGPPTPAMHIDDLHRLFELFPMVPPAHVDALLDKLAAHVEEGLKSFDIPCDSDTNIFMSPPSTRVRKPSTKNLPFPPIPILTNGDHAATNGQHLIPQTEDPSTRIPGRKRPRKLTTEPTPPSAHAATATTSTPNPLLLLPSALQPPASAPAPISNYHSHILPAAGPSNQGAANGLVPHGLAGSSLHQIGNFSAAAAAAAAVAASAAAVAAAADQPTDMSDVVRRAETLMHVMRGNLAELESIVEELKGHQHNLTTQREQRQRQQEEAEQEEIVRRFTVYSV